MDFVTIDFETANSFRGSPCSAGLVKVRDGVVVDRKQMLMRPPAAVDHFDRFNINIHHINPELVAREPRWRDRLPELMEFIGDDIVLAHNAAFDIGVIRYACAVDNIPWPSMRFSCSLTLARKHLTLPSYRLPFVLEACGATMTDHHNALADAEAVAVIISTMAQQLGASTVEDVCARLDTTVGHMAAGVYHGAVSTRSASSGRVLIAADTNPNADPDGYLYGKIVVFTGKLMAMLRQDAWDAVSNAGGRPEKNTTKNTNLLVLGDFNPANLRPGAMYSAKARRAFELQDKGQDIELMTEADFLQVLDGSATLTDELAALIAGPEDPTGGTTTDMTMDGPPERPSKSPRPLHLTPQPTDQQCAADGCANQAAFKTRTRPTWCEQHLVGFLRDARLQPLEPFTHPDSYWLTRCVVCGCEAHYRLRYVLEQNQLGNPTCRACYWIQWASDARRVQEDACRETGFAPQETDIFDHAVLPAGVANTTDRLLAESQAISGGWEYLGEAPGSIDGFIHRVRCPRCGKIEVRRTSDVGFRCVCTPG